MVDGKLLVTVGGKYVAKHPTVAYGGGRKLILSNVRNSNTVTGVAFPADGEGMLAGSGGTLLNGGGAKDAKTISSQKGKVFIRVVLRPLLYTQT